MAFYVRAEFGTAGSIVVTTREKELTGVVAIPSAVLREGYKGNIGVDFDVEYE